MAGLGGGATPRSSTCRAPRARSARPSRTCPPTRRLSACPSEEDEVPRAKKAPAGPTQVDAIVHTDKRTNLPTADAQEFVSAEVETIATLRYPRDPSLDP